MEKKPVGSEAGWPGEFLEEMQVEGTQSLQAGLRWGRLGAGAEWQSGTGSPSKMGKDLPANAGDTGDAGSTPEWDDPLKEEVAMHSRILLGCCPWSCTRDGPE